MNSPFGYDIRPGRGWPFPMPFPTALVLFVLTLVGYWVLRSPSAFPGPPTQMLLEHLKMEATPARTHLLWGWAVRLAGRLPGWLSIAGWMGLFSAACGALSVTMLSLLMSEVGYVFPGEPGPNSLSREIQARRLSGLVAGLFLASCIPFGILSTRSLPGSFHVVLMLLAALIFKGYQDLGRPSRLVALGLVVGVGITEYATFWILFPLIVILVLREMFRWETLGRWSHHLVFWGALLVGLSLYGFHADAIYRQGLPSQVYATRWAALLDLLAGQGRLVATIRYYHGFPVAMAFCLVPWLALFPLSSRSPWAYDAGPVGMRLVLIGGLLAALYNAAFAPWALMGMGYVLVTPYVVMAGCMGYMAGEFWILGEEHILMDYRRRLRSRRWVASAFALALPVAVLGAVLHNRPVTDGRTAQIVNNVAERVLDSMDEASILFSSGVLDDTLHISIRQRWSPVLLIRGPRTSSPIYLRRLADSFRDPSLRQPLLSGNISKFVQNLCEHEHGLRTMRFIDMPDVFRPFGHLIPDGLAYRIQTDPLDRAAVRDLAASQREFWMDLMEQAKHPIAENNPARPFQNYIRLMVSRVVNHVGVLQARHDERAGALETFRAAWRIYPENLSVLLNLSLLAERLEDPEREEIHAALEELVGDTEGERWRLATLYGEVWNARHWLGRGWVWALSGQIGPEGGAASTEEEEAPPTVLDARQVELVDKAYLRWTQALPPDMAFHARLARNPRDFDAWVGLFRNAMRQGDWLAADVLLQAAREISQTEGLLAFDEAMVDLISGRREEALAQLDVLSHQTPGDPRVWTAVALLTEMDDPRNREAIWVLRNRHADSSMVRMVLASILMSQGQWRQAMTELERTVEMEGYPDHAWELFLAVAQEIGNPRLIDASVRGLTARNPDHYIRFQNEGVAHYQKGEYELAERTFRAGLRRSRSPVLLNNLAHVVRVRGGDLAEALALVNEALALQPGTPSMHNTRAQIHMSAGRLTDARADVLDALRNGGRNLDTLLDLMETVMAQGDRRQAAAFLRVADALEAHLTPPQRERVGAIRQALGPGPTAGNPR